MTADMVPYGTVFEGIRLWDVLLASDVHAQVPCIVEALTIRESPQDYEGNRRSIHLTSETGTLWI